MKKVKKVKKVWIALCVLMAACGEGATNSESERIEIETPGPCDWPQVFGTPDHAGRTCPELHGLQVVKQIVQDPDAASEIASNGFLQVHESPVVTQNGWVIVPTKDGFGTDHNGLPVQDKVRYHVAGYHWDSPTALNSRWTADTDFQTVDAVVGSGDFITNFYVQEFAVGIGNGSIYAPAASGQFLRLDLATGALIARINPFDGTSLDKDHRLTVTSAPTVAPDGTVYYTATAWPTGPGSVFGVTPRGSWLVAIHPDNTTAIVDWSPDNAIKLGGSGIASLANIPRLGDLCAYAFGTLGTPPPTSPDSQPPLFHCGEQRPALNAPVAISPVTGHLIALSYSNNAPGVGFLIEIDPTTLLPILAADVRHTHLRNGCGVRLDAVTFPNCNALTAGGTTNLGADPNLNGDVRLRFPADIMNSAPAVAPDGKVAIASYTGGFSFGGDFDARGAIVAFRADGSFDSNNPEFGWEVTPSARRTSPCSSPLCAGYQWLQDRDLYSDFDLGLATYSSSFQLQTVGTAPPVLFGDFVDSNVTFGSAGDHYGFTEAGTFYKLNAGGTIVASVQLTADAPIVLSGHTARDPGHAYVTYGGIVYVIGSAENEVDVVQPAVMARVTGSRMVKIRAASSTPEPGPPVE